MKILRRVEEARAFSRECRGRGEVVALVPTMGYLHEGHLSLVRLARECSDRVMVSIFVNPTQFGPDEDLARYPSDFGRDRGLCEAARVDGVFCPDATEMYPDGYGTTVSVGGGLTNFLCGAGRPGHFDGVATIVTKLFNACEPSVAVFGQKDAQQAVVIKRLVGDLNLPIRIVVAPTSREADGLARSSRNGYLSPEERKEAPVLKAALDAALALFNSGETKASALLFKVKETIASAHLARLEYAQLVDAESLQPVSSVKGPSLLAIAAFFGSTRLIDNILISAKNEE